MEDLPGEVEQLEAKVQHLEEQIMQVTWTMQAVTIYFFWSRTGERGREEEDYLGQE
jgi:hypothetical protein